MPQVLIQIARQAVAALVSGAALGAGFEAASGAIGGGDLSLAIPGRSPDLRVNALGQLIRRRPRRRKALTDSDVRLALTIASAISKKAAEVFIAQRTRSH